MAHRKLRAAWDDDQVHPDGEQAGPDASGWRPQMSERNISSKLYRLSPVWLHNTHFSYKRRALDLPSGPVLRVPECSGARHSRGRVDSCDAQILRAGKGVTRHSAVGKCLSRSESQCSFVEYRDYRVVYRWGFGSCSMLKLRGVMPRCTSLWALTTTRIATSWPS